MNYSKLAKIADSVNKVSDETFEYGPIKALLDNGKSAKEILEAFCDLKGTEGCKEFIAYLISEGYPESDAECILEYQEENNLDFEDLLKKLIIFMDGVTTEEIVKKLSDSKKVQDSYNDKLYAIKVTDKDGKEQFACSSDGVALGFSDKLTNSCLFSDAPCMGDEETPLVKSMLDYWVEEHPELTFQCYTWSYDSGLGEQCDCPTEPAKNTEE